MKNETAAEVEARDFKFWADKLAESLLCEINVAKHHQENPWRSEEILENYNRWRAARQFKEPVVEQVEQTPPLAVRGFVFDEGDFGKWIDNHPLSYGDITPERAARYGFNQCKAQAEVVIAGYKSALVAQEIDLNAKLLSEVQSREELEAELKRIKGGVRETMTNDQTRRSDLELATAFFTRLQERGYPLKINHEAYGRVDDLGEPHPIVFEIQDDVQDTVFEFDFRRDGRFYRISGFDRTGGWRDELNWSKY